MVDSPFQMDHPDLAANTDPGWDVVTDTPVTSSAGNWHSTGGAGMAAAIINNARGVAGVVNCRVLPININGFIDEMYRALIWSADHGVRVVNISWSGGNSPTVNESGTYLMTRARGILAMAGVNGSGLLNYTNQPSIYCVSMTDIADNMLSYHGNHIDFSAPGYGVYTTSSGSSYAAQTGTSFSTPLFCGVVAMLFSINPTLSPEDAIGILRISAADLGMPGWDQYFGWGRINFGQAAAQAQESLRIRSVVRTSSGAEVSAPFRSGVSYKLWRTTEMSSREWLPVANPTSRTNNGVITLTDPEPTAARCFYRMEQAVPTP
jgi:subtilisin family serine protease